VPLPQARKIAANKSVFKHGGAKNTKKIQKQSHREPIKQIYKNSSTVQTNPDSEATEPRAL